VRATPQTVTILTTTTTMVTITTKATLLDGLLGEANDATAR